MAERSRGTQLSGTYTLHIPVNTIALGTSEEAALFTSAFGASIQVTAVSITGKDAVTGDATNNLALQIRNKGTAGTGTTAVTDVKTYAASVDIVAFKEDALVVSTTVADATIDDGETVSINKTENGTGLAMPEGTINISYKYV